MRFSPPRASWPGVVRPVRISPRFLSHLNRRFPVRVFASRRQPPFDIVAPCVFSRVVSLVRCPLRISAPQTGRLHHGARPSPAPSCRFTRCHRSPSPAPATAATAPRCPSKQSRQDTAPVMPVAARNRTAARAARFFPPVCGGLFRIPSSREQTPSNRKEKQHEQDKEQPGNAEGGSDIS